LLKKIYHILFIYDLNGSSAQPLNCAGEPFRKKLMRDITGLILVCYTLFVLNPVMPIFADILAHTFWEKEHLMTVHKSHGKFHVHFELVKASKQADKDKSSGNFKSGSEDTVHIIYDTEYDFSNKCFVNNSYSLCTFLCPTSYPNVDYPPPRA
jgi:hypothetical protein